ncbi:MAG: ABC transporter substrate-binding protein [Polynucleobacter sp.]|jgi:branched-chain amino acid transport system substrate-binding protein|nr:ABC transporter substrate-binding protein [Polynucleobacter sp.]
MKFFQKFKVAFLSATFILGATYNQVIAQDKGPIRIGVLAPITGPLATPGQEMLDGLKMYWEQNKYTAGGRKIELVIADTTCNPDQALTQARRLALQEKVSFLLGPLCGHEGPAVAQVSKETGIPLILDPAGADTNTKWDRTPTVVRTAVSASQIGHPFGDYLYKDLGGRNVTFIASDYTWGHEVAGGMMRTYTEAGGKINKVIWAPLATTDYGASIAAIPSDSDAVVVVLAGVSRIRFFEAWYNFGYNKKFKLHGGYWLHEDAIPQIDDRAVGLISNTVHYVAGIDTPENKTFVDEYARRYKKLPSWFAESSYTSSMWTKAAIDSIKGNVEDRAAFLKAMRTVKITNAPRGPLVLDAYDNPIQNMYITRLQKVKHPILGDQLMNIPVKTYKEVSQFWTYPPEEFLKRGPYKR